jgi:oxygen-dependent protoporphyrinogen oxidase
MRAVVIGAGISGLACAYRLRQLGARVTLLEAASRVGGVIDSARQQGLLFEQGPQSFLSSDAVLELVAALRLDGELLRADSRAPRFVLLGGRLHRVPMAPPSLLSTSLLSLRSRLRLLAEPFRGTQPPATDESVADFVRRKFGGELLEHLVGPLVSGVYAGDPEKLSLRSAFPMVHQWEKEHGSVIRGAMKSRPPRDRPRATLCTFCDGVAALPRRLAAELGDAVRTEVWMEPLRRGKSNGKSHFTLELRLTSGAELLEADAVVVATSTAAAAELLATLAPRAAHTLRQIPYAPVAVVGAVYRREQVGVAPEGFGYLVPRKEGRRILGTVWNSSLFPGRAPDGMVNFTTFAGGATDPELVSRSEEEIAAAVEKDVAEVMRIQGAPVARVVRCHERALPQYTLGHAERILALQQELARIPGLFLTGSYLGGPAIAACVEQAFRTAQSVWEYLAAGEEAAARPERSRGARARPP